MHGLAYLLFVCHENDENILEFNNLTHHSFGLNLDYLSILENQGITLKDIKETPETSDIKIHLENSKYPLYYSFLQGEFAVLIAVSQSQNPKISNILHQIIDFF